MWMEKGYSAVSVYGGNGTRVYCIWVWKKDRFRRFRVWRAWVCAYGSGNFLAHVNREEGHKFGDSRSRYRIRDSDGRRTTQLETYAAIFTTYGGAIKLVRALGKESGRSTQQLVDRLAILLARIGARRLRIAVGPRESVLDQ